MTRSEFLGSLRAGLSGLPAQEVDDILTDYESHFADGLAAGRSENEISAALGDPWRLARELRVEAGFKRWENQRSAGNFFGIVMALLGLAAVDFMLLLPALGVLAGFLVGFAGVALAFCIGGIVLIASVPIGFLSHAGSVLARGLAGIGLLAGGIGGGALLVMLIEWLARLLVRYARLHYRLLTSVNQAV